MFINLSTSFQVPPAPTSPHPSVIGRAPGQAPRSQGRDPFFSPWVTKGLVVPRLGSESTRSDNLSGPTSGSEFRLSEIFTVSA